MRVSDEIKNSSFMSLVDNPDQVVFLDTNFFIPPDRSELTGMRLEFSRFESFKEMWLDPLLSEFRSISIHESVYAEFVDTNVKRFADDNIKKAPSRLKVYYDSDLNEKEKGLMDAFIDKLAIHSGYDPGKDSAKDRGEILSLSYMAAKGFLYFAAKDDLPIRLITDADKLETGLVDMGIIQMYELIYYLYKKGRYDNKRLRGLYKYLYYLTDREKRQNPDWGTFIQKMDELYGELLSQ